MNSFFYIHPLVLLIFIIAHFTKNFQITLLIYIVAMIHELFHLMMAYRLKIKIKGISILPFGISLKIKDNRIGNPIHEILIAIAGPFSNLLMLTIALILKSYFHLNSDNMSFFILANILIGLINIVPILPLDGGRVLKSIFTIKIGFIKSFKIMKKITAITSIILLVSGVYLLYITKLNYSLILISLFLIYNLSKEISNNNLLAMYDIINYKKKVIHKKIFKAKNIVAMYDTPAQEIIRLLTYNYFYLIIVIDEKMRIIGILTETQIIKGLLSLGSGATIHNVLKAVDSI